MEVGMFPSVAIPAILPVRSIADRNCGTPSRPSNTAGSRNIVSTGGGAPQCQERAHTNMTAEKSTDSTNKDTKACSSDTPALDFGMLYEKFRRPIHSYIYRLLGNQEDADDLTQEVFTPYAVTALVSILRARVKKTFPTYPPIPEASQKLLSGSIFDLPWQKCLWNMLLHLY